MFYIIIIILIIIFYGYQYKELFHPFSYGNVNPNSSYINNSNLIYPNPFKFGEININYKKQKNNKINNYSCNCCQN